jgi:hypothetical protein
MGEQLEYGLAVSGIVVVEMGIHTAHQVCLSCLQVIECLGGGFQFDDIGNVEFLEDKFEQVDVIAYGFTVLVQKGIGPQVPRILVDKGMLVIEYLYAVVTSRSRWKAGGEYRPDEGKEAD